MKSLDFGTNAPPTQGASILLLDPDIKEGERIETELKSCGHDVTLKTAAHEALALAAIQKFDVVITELGSNNLDVCRGMLKTSPDTQVIVIGKAGSGEISAGILRAGAYDFIAKPVDSDTLVAAMNRALEHRRLMQEVVALRKALDVPSMADERLVGQSVPMRELLSLIERLALRDNPILVLGKRGTGKETIARELHHQDKKRHNAPFVMLNCSAIPRGLLESELFGHVKGAVADSHSDRIGALREAQGGVLFLNEIESLSLDLQEKLLRALDERTVQPVGASGRFAFDARVISSSERDLEKSVVAGTFLEGLLRKLDVATVHLPDLRDRGNDVLLLSQAFLRRVCRSSSKFVTGFTPEASQLLLDYSWPGNVTQLYSYIERAVAVCRGAVIDVQDLPTRIKSNARGTTVQQETSDSLLPLHEIERQHIMHVLHQVGCNKRRAAQVLGLDRTTLYRRLEQYGIEPSDVKYERTPTTADKF